MKKNVTKKNIFAVLLLLLCILISGCQGKSTETESPETKIQETGTTSAETTETVRNTSDTPAKTKTPEQIQSDLLKRLYRTDGENEGAYVLPIDLDEGEYVLRMECFREKLLVLSGGKGLNVRLFNLDTGRMINHIKYDVGYEDLGEGGFLEDGSLWIFVPARETIYYMDQNLQEMDCVKMDVLYRSLWYSDYGKDILWTLNYEEGMLHYYQIETRYSGEYNMEELLGEKADSEGVWWNLDKVGSGFAWLTVTTDCHQQDRYRFSVLTKQMDEDALANISAMSCSESGSYYHFRDKYRVVDFSSPENVITLEGISEKEQFITYCQQYLFSGIDNKLNIYDLNRRFCYMGYQMDISEGEGNLWNYISAAAARPDTRQVLFSVSTAWETKIVLCDLEMIKNMHKISVIRFSEEDIRAKVEEIDRRIEREYGIRMITLEEAWERNDWSGYTLWDNVHILDELDAAETFKDFLDGMPPGMVAEMLEAREGKVEVCFSGTISGDESEGNLSYAGAYVTSGVDDRGGESSFYTRMAADISLKDVLQTNFSHEWFHMMEERIWDYEAGRNELLYDWGEQWNSISPEDAYFYEYNESLAFDEERGIDVYVGEEDMKDVYFIDAYSRTFPTEDRARIFENLYMAGMNGELPRCFESEHIRRKAVYLCQLIRCCYPSADTAEKNIWEQGLCSEDWNLILENRDRRLKQF